MGGKKSCCLSLDKLYNNKNIKLYKRGLFKYNLYYDNYEDAIKYENRKICYIFIIFFVIKEKIIKTFCFLSPLELKSLHICLLIFIFSCNFALNSLFYFSDNISDKYHYKEDSLLLISAINNISICLISTSVSSFIIFLLKYLINITKAIETSIREEEKKFSQNKRHAINKKTKIKIFFKLLKVYNGFKKKFFLFIFIELILLLFFFYFSTAFCEVYKSTQISWAIDCIISSIFSIIIELLFTIGITILYILSYKNKLNCLFNLALILIWNECKAMINLLTYLLLSDFKYFKLL